MHGVSHHEPYLPGPTLLCRMHFFPGLHLPNCKQWKLGVWEPVNEARLLAFRSTATTMGWPTLKMRDFSVRTLKIKAGQVLHLHNIACQLEGEMSNFQWEHGTSTLAILPQVWFFSCMLNRIGAISPTPISPTPISPTPISPTPISPTYYCSVPFHLLMQNVTKQYETVETSCTSL